MQHDNVDNVITEEQVKFQPYHKLGDIRDIGEQAEKTAPRQRLSLKYLQGLIETLQEDQHKLSERVDELSRMVAGENSTAENNQSIPRDSAGWASAALPAATAEGRLSSQEDPAYLESILQELKEAARIADEIAEHAAAGEQPASLPMGDADGLSSSPASGTAASIAQSPPHADYSPISISRAERHHRQKRSFWSRLFGR